MQHQPVMQAIGVSKQYPGTLALNEVSFDIYPGKVNVLIGENGAGKSTLMKILAGIEKPTSGKILLDGKEVKFQNTREASAAGVGIIHQELNLFPEMKVADNMFAGKELKKHGMIDRKTQVKRASEILDTLQPGIDPNDIMLNLRVGQQQIVEIAKTMLHDQLKVLIMDEPTSSLSNAEVEVLFTLIEDLKKRGIAIIYISHRLEEIIRVGDYVTILRDGKWVANAEVKDISVSWIVEKMVGHSNLTIEKIPYSGEKEELMQVQDYCLPRLGGGWTVDHVSFTLHKGEVLGIYGLMGAGRTELVESLMGLHSESTGTIVIGGETIQKPNVTDQIARGMVLVPEDRQKDGLVQTMSISDNLLLTSIPQFTRNGIINKAQCKEAVKQTVKDMQVKVADVKHLITSLSGGNQQKVVIGKCVMANAKIFMMDEPSRGIDVGAKTDIFILMRQFAAQGNGVIFVGSELKEIISVCDRVLVMSNGKLTADLTGDEITEDALVIASAANLHTGKAAKSEGSAT
ncbi:MAG: sugar ABC transporter ATP-binding protein [Clostridia bacterium]|nr:sugar ABC transporter ATP-binding protein [Clostridia bacterium]MBP3653112.1 sugar ABC transporter ATP-binding protein [Clostridia bacterium]